jgi:integrase
LQASTIRHTTQDRGRRRYYYKSQLGLAGRNSEHRSYRKMRFDVGRLFRKRLGDLAVLRRFLSLAERQRLIARNPFAQVDMLDERKTRKQPHIVTFEEQAKLLAVATPHLRCLIALLVDTVLRVNCEALKMTWHDVDFAKAQIVVRESKTMAGRRVVPLSEFCKAKLLRAN